jgi:hypothetical protein
MKNMDYKSYEGGACDSGGGILDFLDDYIMGPLNLLDRLERLITGARFGDMGYQIAIKRMDKGGKHSLSDVERLLKKFGVAVYGRTHDSQNMYFHFKKRQGVWASYILGRHGIEVESEIYDGQSYSKGSARQGERMFSWAEKKQGKHLVADDADGGDWTDDIPLPDGDLAPDWTNPKRGGRERKRPQRKRNRTRRRRRR